MNINGLSVIIFNNHSKKATLWRKAEKYIEEIKVRSARYELVQITQQIMENICLGHDVSELEKKKEAVSKIAKRQLQQNITRHEFHAHLQEYITRNNLGEERISGGSIKDVVTGVFQTDPLICKRYMMNMSDGVVGNDADFAMYVGKSLVQLKDFKINAKTNDISGVVLSFAGNSLCKKAKEIIMTSFNHSTQCNENLAVHVQKDKQTKEIISTTEIDLFAQHDDLETRALIALALGCDVYKGGIKGIGVVTLLKNYNEQTNTTMKDYLKETMNKHFGNQGELTDTYLESIIYEPCNCNENNEYTYFDKTPSSLHKYNEAFAPQDGQCLICDASDNILTCNGFEGVLPHPFLSFEKKSCASCKNMYCRYCCVMNDDNSKHMCISCYKEEKLNGINDCDTQDRAKMIKEIKEKSYGGGYDSLGDCTMEYVQKLYQEIVVEGNVTQDVSEVEYPLAPATAFDDESYMATVGSFDIYSEGGSFVSRPQLKQHLPDILRFLSTCITFDNKVKFTSFESPVYSVIPSFITKIANKSRRDSGYRLCVRCLRHVTDAKYAPTKMSSVRIVRVKVDGREKIAFEWSCRVPASMKASIYTTRTCVTCDGELFSSVCSCRIGGENTTGPEEEVDSSKNALCVHGPACIAKMPMELTDTLADDICCELSALGRRMNLKNEYNENEYTVIVSSIQKLASVALFIDENITTKELQTMDINELLQKYFSVGTDRVNSRLENRERISFSNEHVRLSSLQRSSIFKKGQDVFKQEDGVSRKENKHKKPRIEKFKPDYQRCLSVLRLFVEENSPLLEFIGIILVLYRVFCNAVSYKQEFFMMKQDKSLKKKWKQLKQCANFRSKKENRYTNPKSNSISVSPVSRKRKREESIRRSPRLLEKSLLVSNKSSKRPRGKRTCRWMCCFPGCTNTDVTTGKKWYKVPKLRKYPKTSRLDQIRNYHIQKKKRRVIRELLGGAKNHKLWDSNNGSERNGLKWCSDHDHSGAKKERVEFSFNGKQHKDTFEISPFPSPMGRKSTLQLSSSVSKGSSIDRHNTKFLSDLNESEKLSIVAGDVMYSPSKMYSETAATKLPLTDRQKVIPVRLFEDTSDTTKICQKNNDTNENNLYIPSVKPGMIDKEVKRRTGFISEMAMLAYIVVVCNGDIDVIGKTISTLTWYEQWFLFFERIWAQASRREMDIASAFNVDERVARDIIDYHTALVLSCRMSWPTYPSYVEDWALCNKEKWLNKYEGLRIVMWDDTNMQMNFKPSSALEQRLTYSQYYAGNCAKIAVFIVLCGFMGVSESLWSGGISDTEVMMKEDADDDKTHASDEPYSIFGRQLHFQRADLVNGIMKPFHNIVDKGYRIAQAAIALMQYVIQPNFCNANRNFKGEETLCISEVATDRAGNERAVKRLKESAMITDGIRSNCSYQRVENLVKAYSFQCNFMFKPVH